MAHFIPSPHAEEYKRWLGPIFCVADLRRMLMREPPEEVAAVVLAELRAREAYAATRLRPSRTRIAARRAARLRGKAPEVRAARSAAKRLRRAVQYGTCSACGGGTIPPLRESCCDDFRRCLCCGAELSL